MMRKLTQAQENFARLYVELGNAAEAYRQAYPKSQKWQDQSVWAKASALANADMVSIRVSKLRQSAESKTLITLESHLNELESLREMAKEQGNISAAIQAEVSRGKAKGLYVTKIEVDDVPPATVVNVNVVDARKQD
jgi:phage terminase small subunit